MKKSVLESLPKADEWQLQMLLVRNAGRECWKTMELGPRDEVVGMRNELIRMALENGTGREFRMYYHREDGTATLVATDIIGSLQVPPA